MQKVTLNNALQANGPGSRYLDSFYDWDDSNKSRLEQECPTELKRATEFNSVRQRLKLAPPDTPIWIKADHSISFAHPGHDQGWYAIHQDGKIKRFNHDAYKQHLAAGGTIRVD